MRVAVLEPGAAPRVLLLDEPFSALDIETEHVRQVLFGQIKNDQSYGILVTHHAEDRPPEGMYILDAFIMKRLRTPLRAMVNHWHQSVSPQLNSQ